MTFKLLLISVIALTILKTESSNATEIECQVYSDFYKEYLYARYKLLGLGSSRGANLWKEMKSFAQQIEKHASQMSFNNSDLSGVWYFKPVSGYKNTFILRNKKYPNEYLSGSDSYQEFFSKNNRQVNVRKIKSEGDQAFMWNFRSVPRTNLYQIWNVKYSSPLYAQNFVGDREGNNRRKIALWHIQETHTDQFNWVLICNNNIMPIIVEST